MDVVFESQKEGTFPIEIGYFDSVLEIKEKIHKYKDIPITHQTLVFNGKILDDGGDVESCVILNDSHIQLIVAPPHREKVPETLKVVKTEEQLSPVIVKKTQLIIKSTSKSLPLSLDVDLNDYVEQLKDKVHEIEGVPKNQLALFVNGNHELQDHRHLNEYELVDGSEIDVLIRPTSSPTASGMTNTIPAGIPKRLKVMVLTKCGTRKLLAEVNPMDKVQVLRNELEKWQKTVNFQLPPEGYFFIYKQNVMEEGETFQWHNVRQGDAIEIFNGSITGGS